MARLLIIVGLIFIGVGLLIKLGLPLGRLPGDITLRRGGATFYFPIVTCLVVSIILSILAALFRR